MYVIVFDKSNDFNTDIHPTAGTYENEKPHAGSTQHSMANLARDTPRLHPRDHEKFPIHPIYSAFSVPLVLAFLAADFLCGFFTPAGEDSFFGALTGLRGLAAAGALNCLGSIGQWWMTK